VGIDVRTRTDADIRGVEFAAFFDHEFPPLVAAHGAIAARSAARLALPPLTLKVGGSAQSLLPTPATIAIVQAERADAVIVEMGPAAFSDWVQELRTMLALLVSADAVVVKGDPNAALGWDAVLRTIIDKREIYEPGSVPLTNRDGSTLDVLRSFGPDADDAEMRWFLEQAGFLMLKGWVDPDRVAAIYEDMDTAIAMATRTNPHTWWAELQDGTERCVRVKHFCEISETGRLEAESAAFRRVCDLTGVDFPMPAPCIEALIKPAGVVAGPSEIRWHKDCWQGRHAFFCSGLTVGILVTPSNEETGCIRVMAGSHRTNFPAVDRAIDAIDLPVRSLYGEPGDLTVHLSCTMHETIPPISGERRLMYAGFSLREPDGESGVDNRYAIKHADWSNAVSSAWKVYA
jgi:hypothetical protein